MPFDPVYKGNRQAIYETSVTGTRSVSLSPTYSSVDDYVVSDPRAEDSSGNFLLVKIVKHTTTVDIVVDDGFTAAFVECAVQPV